MFHCHSGLDPESPEGFEILKQVQDDILGVQDDISSAQDDTLRILGVLDNVLLLGMMMRQNKWGL